MAMNCMCFMMLKLSLISSLTTFSNIYYLFISIFHPFVYHINIYSFNILFFNLSKMFLFLSFSVVIVASHTQKRKFLRISFNFHSIRFVEFNDLEDWIQIFLLSVSFQLFRAYIRNIQNTMRILKMKKFKVVK